MNRKITVSVAVTLMLIVATVTFSITMVVAMQMFDNTISSINEKETLFSNLAEINTYVSSNGYYDFSYDTVDDTTASGFMLGVADANAHYYTAKAYTEYQEIQSGKLMGIGVDLVKDSATGYALVTRVYSDSPAEEAGLVKGCKITTITDADGNVTEVKNLSDADAVYSKLRGEDGVAVTISYTGTDGALVENVAITHHGYNVPTVESQLLNDVSGYIRIYDFNSNTAGELDRAINDLIGQGAADFVIDLRYNKGGTLTDAMKAADRVVGKGVLAVSEDKAGEQTILYNSDDTCVDLPIVCLVNNETAAGAELFASCVKYMNGGGIAGLRTAGKGTIQAEPQRMSNGSAVVITVAKLLTVLGDGSYYSFDGTGLTPDYEVSLSADEEAVYYDLTPENDRQVQGALEQVNGMAGIATESAMSDDGIDWGDSTSDAAEEPAPEETTEEPAAEETAAEASTEANAG